MAADKQRRKSFSILRETLRPLTPVHDRKHSPAASPLGFKYKKRHSFFGSSSTTSNNSSPDLDVPNRGKYEYNDSPRVRSRVLTKAPRPSSIFGSWKSLRSAEEEERLDTAASRRSSIEDVASGVVTAIELEKNSVLHHGEVQTTGGVFRKKNQYLVLTESNLVRFKNRHKAAEVFPAVSPTARRNSTSFSRHGSVPSSGSLPDIQAAAAPAEGYAAVPLKSIIAAYRLDDGKPYFTIELSILNEETGATSTLDLQINDFEDCQMWLLGIRQASEGARFADPPVFAQRSVDHAAIVLERDRDYDPRHFRMFSVVQRSLNKSVSRSSTEDLSKPCSIICYLIIGINKVHLVPLPKISNRSSSSSLADLDGLQSWGITTLTHLTASTSDDCFQMGFRMPLRPEINIQLASSASVEIIMSIRQESEFLRPLWVQQPCFVEGPKACVEELPQVLPTEQDLMGFDRTLIAYCAGYNIDTSNICYEVDDQCEDAPCFRLRSPARKRNYTALELMAIMRALRYNESFGSISFAGISLDPLYEIYDQFGVDLGCRPLQAGYLIDIGDGDLPRTILVQEIRALALNSKRLRRFDFSYSITRDPRQGGSRDPGCGIPAALFPLCSRHLTNVDWIVLSGIKLGETDLEYLVDAAAQKACHLRALEISNCGIRDHELDMILTAMYHQENTLEAVDISANLVRLNPETFQDRIGHFSHIRKINLSRTQQTSGPGPLISPETLLAWRLEELDFSGTALNEQTVDSISVYLHSEKSSTLRLLRFDQCGLTGKDVAVFMRSMSNRKDVVRDLHLHVSQNRLGVDYSHIFDAITDNMTPTRLTMKMIDYKKEEHFRLLANALRKNTTLQYLDISKTSLPYDASDETCDMLKQMFAENSTLQELDISGEQAHLDIARFGIGLNQALTGLKENHSLKVLRIEHQKLGLQGANTLASVLEVNNCLECIYCDHNDFNLQSFTVLINGLRRNTSILFLTSMDHDRAESIRKVKREISSVAPTSMRSSSGHASHGVRRFSARITSKSNSVKETSSTGHCTYQDTQTALQSLSERWDGEVERLRQYLMRNLQLSQGIPSISGENVESGANKENEEQQDSKEEEDKIIDDGAEMEDAKTEQNSRPDTLSNLDHILEAITFDTTPLESHLKFEL